MVNLGARGLLDRTVGPIIASGLYALGPERPHNNFHSTAESKFLNCYLAARCN